MEKNGIISRLQELLENETRSCSMDFGSITPLYVYRMWGGSASLEDITQGLTELRGQEGQVSVSQWREDTSRAA